MRINNNYNNKENNEKDFEITISVPRINSLPEKICKITPQEEKAVSCIFDLSFEIFAGENSFGNYSTINTTIYTPFKEWMMISNRTGTYNYTYVYDGSTLVARINPDGSKWFYHDDHLGSTFLITDENGIIVEYILNNN